MMTAEEMVKKIQATVYKKITSDGGEITRGSGKITRGGGEIEGFRRSRALTRRRNEDDGRTN